MLREGYRNMSNEFGHLEVLKSIATISNDIALAHSSVYCIRLVQLLQLDCKRLGTGTVSGNGIILSSTLDL